MYISPSKGRELNQVVRSLAQGQIDGAGDTLMQKALDVARRRWGEQATPTRMLTKAAVSSDWAALFAYEQEGFEWIEAVREASVFGQLPIRYVSPQVQHIVADNDFSAGFFSESKALPLSAMSLSQEDLKLKKVGAMVAMSSESLKDGSLESQAAIDRDIIRAAGEAVDSRFLDPSEDGTGEAPASVTNGAEEIESTQDPEQDFSLLLEAFRGNLMTAAWIMHPRTAAELAMTGIDAFRNVGILGGEALGIPVYTTRMSPRDSDGGQVLLLDGASVIAAERMPEFLPSQNATIEFSSTPTGATDTPTAATSFMVSAFQCDAVVIRMIRRIVWKLIRADAAVFVSGANYGGAS